MSDLTTDQRWLLYFMGGWEIRDCLLAPAGTDHLMQSMSGACGHAHPDGGPVWMTGWNTRSGKITAPGHGEARVVISKAQINAYARGLPAAIRAELIAVRELDRAENARAYDCPWSTTAPNAHSGPCTRYHPTHDEADAHRARARRIGQQLDDVLRRALRIGHPTAVQLELFAPG